MDIEIVEETHGWTYRIGGVYQPYHPDKEGFVPMTEAEAQACAGIVLARMEQP